MPSALYYTVSVDKALEPNACFEEAQDGRIQGIDSAAAEPKEPRDFYNAWLDEARNGRM